MSDLENNIVTWLTGKQNLDEVPLSQLQNIVVEYPYFTIAQLLLTAKLKKENHSDYGKQLQKTALNFHDPKWLYFQLSQLTEENQNPLSESIILPISSEKELETPVEAIQSFDNIEIAASIWDQNPEEENPSISENESDTKTEINNNEIPQTNTETEKLKIREFLKSVMEGNTSSNNIQIEPQQESVVSENQNTEEHSDIFEEEIQEDIEISSSNVEENPTIEETQNIEDVVYMDNIEIVPEQQLEEGSEVTDSKEDVAIEEAKPISIDESENIEHSESEHEITDSEPDQIYTEENIEAKDETPTMQVVANTDSIEIAYDQPSKVEPEITEFKEDVAIEEVSPTNIEKEENIPTTEGGENIETPEQQINLESDAQVSEEKDSDIKSESEEENLIGDRISSQLADIATSFKSEPVSNEPLLPAQPEPAHVKDYFASLGIKVDNSIQTDFGHKVKKFTDWLKVMKKINSPNDLLKTTASEEIQVAKDAAKSNQNSDIITEAMVDVLVKQGKKNEAIEILNRLSLLKPEKSSYFASQIKVLNEN